MKIGMIGLGRMGSNMTQRLLKKGHSIVGYARTAESVRRIVDRGAIGAGSLEELVEHLSPPRIVWLMIPAGKDVDNTIDSLLSLLSIGDIIIDGGNSNYKDTLRRALKLREKGIHFLDVGTSGGTWGLSKGYCMMIGGEAEVIEEVRPIFESLAPEQDKGWGHVGPNGAGHFVKMIHNGIEYGLMQAYSEGLSILRHSPDFGFDLHQISEIWRYGSVIRSWLLDLIGRALEEGSDLSDVEPFVEDSGEGRWTVFEAINRDVPAPILTLSLLQRLRSRDKDSYSDRLLALMREQFGGHSVKRKE